MLREPHTLRVEAITHAGRAGIWAPVSGLPSVLASGGSCLYAQASAIAVP